MELNIYSPCIPSWRGQGRLCCENVTAVFMYVYLKNNVTYLFQLGAWGSVVVKALRY